jgi:hypothetical protein
MLHIRATALRLGFLFLVLFALTGCKHISEYYRGYHIEKERELQLAGSADQGHWKTFDLELNYENEVVGETLNINGYVDFSMYHEMNARRIETFDFYMFFLDNDLKIIETGALIRNADLNDPYDKLKFDKSLQIPADASHYAFGYRGISWGSGGGSNDVGGGGGGMEFFNKLPKRPS